MLLGIIFIMLFIKGFVFDIFGIVVDWCIVVNDEFIFCVYWK